MGHTRKRGALSKHRSMPMSIKQNFSADALPDFRNLGVIARMLLAVNAFAFAAALAAAPNWSAVLDRFLRAAALVEPMLLAAMVALYVAFACAGAPRLLAGLRRGAGDRARR